ncbi:DEAD/DEAH box helicase [Rhizobium sp. NLR8a]|uniref:DEAD/DEAH box helicase n=1 Tax=Rhizobium sp. NLR8a TaxID=2731119 RepID=UPI001C82FD96|nr:DEAD/DEAH box helicase [Rhizobium sp. NLR8a]MBX5218772.1 DEAD/DEAH box helicase [Rhizobium sp. NLR8a]
MDTKDLRALLKTDFSLEEAGLILSAISRLVNARATHDEGRELVIRCLDRRERFPDGLSMVLDGLVRSVGLLPYVAESRASTLEDQLLLEAHRMPIVGEKRVFHTLQLQIYRELVAGRNVVLSATTSVGKSAIIDAVIATGKHHHLAIIVPTIALIDETRRRLATQFGDHYDIVTHPTQITSPERETIFILTQERALTRKDLSLVTFFVIDEFYKLDLRGDDDDERSVDLNLCFHKLASTGAQFYLIGPHVDGVVGLASSYEYLFVPSLFSTVALDIVQFRLPRHGGQREDKLIELCSDLTSPTIVYCQSPHSAHDAASALLDAALFPLVPELDDAVEWLTFEYPSDWIVTTALKHGIGIHHGNIPRALQQYVLRAFESGTLKLLVCTSTMIEGVNTVAENVILFDKRLNNTSLDHFTFRNIAGRAGRMRRYFVGKVFVLEEQPAPDRFTVEIAVGTQGPNAPISLLLDLEDEDLTEVSRDRVKGVREASPLSPETLRLNRHVSVDRQEAIYHLITSDLHLYHDMLAWTGMPRPPQLLGVCDLVFDYLDTNVLKGYGIFSGNALKASITRVQMSQRYREVVDNFVAHRRADTTISDGVELALRFMRKYLSYTFPRHLMAISHIQADIFRRVGLEPGNYGLYAAMCENLFLPAGLYALDEYGVAPETARKLGPGDFKTLDAALDYITAIDLQKTQLLNFERDMIEDMRATLRRKM